MEVLAIIAAVVGLVWAALVLRRGGLLAGLALVMLAGTCFSLPFLKLEGGPVPLTVDRILLVLVVLQYVLWRRWGMADPKPLGRPEWVLLAFTAVMTFSTFSTDWTADNYLPLVWLVLYYFMPLAVYWIARQSPLDERSMRGLLIGLTLFAVYLAVVTIAEWQQAWWLVFPRYIAETAVKDGEWIGRGRGPLLHPIGNGMLLAIGLAVGLAWWPYGGRRGKLLAIALGGLMLAALYATLTRSAWMGAALTLAIIAALATPRRLRWPLLGGGLAIGLALTAVLWDHIMTYKRERHMSAEMAAESAELRPVLAVIAWHMFLDRPLFGCGFSQYRLTHLDYTEDRSGDLPLNKGRGYIAHNVLLSLLTETGLVGLLLFVALLTLWALDAWRLWTAPLAPLWARQQGLLFLVALGAYLVNGMFHDISLIPMGNMTLYFMAGLTAALRPWAAVSLERRTSRVENREPRVEHPGTMRPLAT